MDVIERAERWMADDPDPATRREVRQLLDRNDLVTLHDCFDTSVALCGSKLVGRLGPGPNRFNQVTVIRVVAALCAWLRRSLPNATERGICVGFDARKTSRELADTAAGVIAAAGFQVWIVDGAMPTPVLGFSVLQTGAAAGVMISGGDSPATYNGLKLFSGDGAPIARAEQEDIVEELDRIENATRVPRWTRHEAITHGRMQALTDLVTRYREQVRGLIGPSFEARRFPIAYTALHGVGDRFVRTILGSAGFSGLKSVGSQAEPNGGFPTVESPDPQSPEAMRQVVALARRIGAELALANDPDGGRLAVAMLADNDYELLPGADVASLLADDLLTRTEATQKRVIVSSGVESPLLTKTVEAHGARWERVDDEDGSIYRRAIELEREGYQFILGFDDSLGYGPTTFVRDRDGISAALLVADLAARCRARGLTLIDQREALRRRH